MILALGITASDASAYTVSTSFLYDTTSRSAMKLPTYEALHRLNCEKSGSGSCAHLFVNAPAYIASHSSYYEWKLLHSQWFTVPNGEPYPYIWCDGSEARYAYVRDGVAYLCLMTLDYVSSDNRSYTVTQNWCYWSAGNLQPSDSGEKLWNAFGWTTYLYSHRKFTSSSKLVQADKHRFSNSGIFSGIELVHDPQLEIPLLLREEFEYAQEMAYNGTSAMHYANEEEIFSAVMDAFADLPMAFNNTVLNVVELAGAVKGIYDAVRHLKWSHITSKAQGKKFYKQLLEEADQSIEDLYSSVKKYKIKVTDLRSAKSWTRTKKVRQLSSRTVKDSVGDIWLKYRYCYLTGVADVREYHDTIQRNLRIINLDTISISGKYVNSAGVLTRVSIPIDTRPLIPSNVWEVLQVFGFNQPLTNAWDAVPFSFMIDWFFDISGRLSDWELYHSYQIKFGGIQGWVTRKYIDGNSRFFSRFPLLRWPPFCERMHLSTRSKVWLARVNDTLAIFF